MRVCLAIITVFLVGPVLSDGPHVTHAQAAATRHGELTVSNPRLMRGRPRRSRCHRRTCSACSARATCNPSGTSLGLGIKNNARSISQADAKSGVLRAWEPLQQEGYLACAVIAAPGTFVESRSADGNYLLLATLPPHGDRPCITWAPRGTKLARSPTRRHGTPISRAKPRACARRRPFDSTHHDCS